MRMNLMRLVDDTTWIHMEVLLLSQVVSTLNLWKPHIQ